MRTLTKAGGHGSESEEKVNVEEEDLASKGGIEVARQDQVEIEGWFAGGRKGEIENEDQIEG